MTKALCHPDRKHSAKGLCLQCYNKMSHLRWRSNPENAEKARKRARQWHENNRDRAKERDYKKHITRKYGLEVSTYNRMFEEQEGKCKICGNKGLPGKRLHIDHNHKTGKVRALLCHHCNSGLGQFFEDKALLKAATDYLIFYEELGEWKS